MLQNKKPYVKVEFDLGVPEQKELYDDIRSYNPQKFRSMSKYIIECLLEHADKRKKHKMMEQYMQMEMDIQKDKKKQEQISDLVQNASETLTTDSKNELDKRIMSVPVKRSNESSIVQGNDNNVEDYLDLENVNESLMDML